jgi:hypothetical protein
LKGREPRTGPGLEAKLNASLADGCEEGFLADGLMRRARLNPDTVKRWSESTVTRKRYYRIRDEE